MKHRLLASVLALSLGAPFAMGQAAPAAPAPAQVQPPKQVPDVAAPKYGRDGQIDKRFMQLHEQFVERAKKGDVELLFLGDSITQGWGNNEVWQKNYAPLKAANFGIGGDRTQHVLWRIENGEIEGISPKAAVLMIGTNNTGSDSAEDIAKGITKIVSTLREKLPKTKILLLAVFPRAEKPDHPARAKIAEINKQISKLDDGKMIHYLDIGPKFLEADGTLSKKIMPDFLHLSKEGYQIWADAIRPKLEELMK